MNVGHCLITCVMEWWIISNSIFGIVERFSVFYYCYRFDSRKDLKSSLFYLLKLTKKTPKHCKKAVIDPSHMLLGNVSKNLKWFNYVFFSFRRVCLFALLCKNSHITKPQKDSFKQSKCKFHKPQENIILPFRHLFTCTHWKDINNIYVLNE